MLAFRYLPPVILLLTLEKGTYFFHSWSPGLKYGLLLAVRCLSFRVFSLPLSPSERSHRPFLIFIADLADSRWQNGLYIKILQRPMLRSGRQYLYFASFTTRRFIGTARLSRKKTEAAVRVEKQYVSEGSKYTFNRHEKR